MAEPNQEQKQGQDPQTTEQSDADVPDNHAMSAAQREVERWEAVERHSWHLRVCCDNVLAGCDEVARKVEECLGFAKPAPAGRHVDTIAEWAKERSAEQQRRKQLQDQLNAITKHRDMLLRKVQATGESENLSARQSLMPDGSKSPLLTTSNVQSMHQNRHPRYDTTSLVSSLDIGKEIVSYSTIPRNGNW